MLFQGLGLKSHWSISERYTCSDSGITGRNCACCARGHNQSAHAGLTKSYIRFSFCKALQSLILGVFLSKRSYKVLSLMEKKVSELEMRFPPWNKST